MHIIHCKSNTDNSRFLSGLQDVFEIIHQVEDSVDEQLCIDLNNVKFVSPLFVLPLMVYAHGSNKKFQFINLTNYLNTVSFGYGIKPDDMRRAEFMAYMESYSHKSYIPVINFQASKRFDDNKNAILSAVEAIIARQLQLENNILAGIKYLIGENVDNITEHSDCDRGYIFAQAYPNLGYLDVCIADNGITLLGSYKKQPGCEIESDLEAIQAANRGVSTKNLPNAENRGFGIVTSKKMLIDGLGGHYVMLSGSSMHVKNRNVDNYFEIPNVRWKGTIVALRIPYNNKAFQYIKYLEY